MIYVTGLTDLDLTHRRSSEFYANFTLYDGHIASNTSGRFYCSLHYLNGRNLRCSGFISRTIHLDKELTQGEYHTKIKYTLTLYYHTRHNTNVYKRVKSRLHMWR